MFQYQYALGAAKGISSGKESTRTHNKGIGKPLLWDRLKDQPRFKAFQREVVHLVLDDTEAFADPQSIFAIESLQEEMRWKSFVRWNDHMQFFGPDDVLGFGDADEIPSRENVHLLRHCEFAGPSVDIGSWFAWSQLDMAFKTDWPVPGNPWTLGDPTYWTLASANEFAKDGTKYPNRMRGKSGHTLLGGIHMTDNRYLPFYLAKRIACSECGDAAIKMMQELATLFQNGNVIVESLHKYSKSHDISSSFDSAEAWRSRFREVGEIQGELGAAYYLPWFLQCNVERYPNWYGKTDSRLE